MNTNNAGSHAYILELPIEMMEAVTAEASAEDLLSLRLTCRDINAKILRLFSWVHFTDKTFMLADQNSMQALEDISEHAVFGKSLRTVNLITLQVSSPQDEARRRNNQGTRDTREARRETREAIQTHRNIFAEHCGHIKADLWRHTIERVLMNFKTNNHGMGIKLALQRLPATSVTGTKALVRRVGHQHGLYDHRSLDVMHVPAVLLNSISDAGCPVDDLSLGDPALSVGLDLLNGKMLDGNIMAAFDRLRKLHISVDIFRSAHTEKRIVPNRLPLQQVASRFSEQLSKLTSLDYLSLALASRYRGNSKFFAIIATDLHLPSLSELKLHRMPLNEHDLVKVLVRHKHTIKHVVVSADVRLGIIGLPRDAVERVASAVAERDIKVKLKLEIW